jgi:hypothetical protein
MFVQIGKLNADRKRYALVIDKFKQLRDKLCQADIALHGLIAGDYPYKHGIHNYNPRIKALDN